MNLPTIRGILGRLQRPKTRIIVISEQRVGSRWLLNMLADLYKKPVSPELARNRHYGEERNDVLKDVRVRLERNMIVKFHHVTPGDILGNFHPIDFRIIGLVRNPRDRGVSVAFHHKNDDEVFGWPQRGMNDADAIRYTITKYPRYPASNARQLDLMIPGYSTKSWTTRCHLPYIWTSYEWLLANVNQEIQRIVDFIGVKPDNPLGKTIADHSFEKKTGRQVGQEERANVRRRKGVTADWKNWFDDEMVSVTQHIYDLYYERLTNEESLQRSYSDS